MPFIKKKKNELVEIKGSEQNCISLVAQLADASPRARRWAVRDLMECPGASDAFTERLKLEEDVSTALTRIGRI